VDVSEWQPATDAEVAMRDALRTDDQESYFRILSGVDLLLPVSAEALAGNAPLGWGTWSTGGRTHVLAFTSTTSLQACLADYTGSARRVPYAELANTWPNLEWWLAVNPGLPIEGYLPAWFVAQLSRGDLRLPTRGPGREKSQPNRIDDLHSALAAKAVTGPPDDAATGPQGLGQPGLGQPGVGQPGYPQPAAAAYGPPGGATSAGYPQQPGYPQFGPQPSSGLPGGYGQPGGYPTPGSGAPSGYPESAGYPQPAGAPNAYASPSGAPSGYPQPGSGQPGGYPQPGSPAAPGYPQPGSPGPSGYPQPNSAPPAGNLEPGSAGLSGYPQRSSAPPGGYSQPGGAGSPGYPPPGSAPPGGYQQPGGVGSAGYPQPGGAGSAGYPQPGGAGSAGYPQPGGAGSAGYPQPGSASPSGHPGLGSAGPAGYPQPGAPPLSPLREAPAGYAQAAAAGQPPGFSAPADARSAPVKPEQVGPGGLPLRTPGAVLPSGLPSRTPTPAPDAVPQPAAPAVPSAYRSPSVPLEAGPTGGWPVVRPDDNQRGGQPHPNNPLPVRTPMANTPPVPEHLLLPDADEAPVDPRWAAIRANQNPPVEAGRGFPQGPASPQAAAAQRLDAAAQRTDAAEQRTDAAAQRAAAAQLGRPPSGGEARPAERPAGPGELAPGFGGPLPRRQAASAADAAPMTSFPAFRSPAERAAMPADSAERGGTPAGSAERGGTPAGSAERGGTPAGSAERAGMTPGLAERAATTSESARSGAVPPAVPGAGSTDRPVGVPSGPPADAVPEVSFDAANAVERDLFEAADGGSTDQFLSTLLLATVLVPVAHHSRPGSAPGESGFAFRTEQIDGEQFLVVFTSRDRLGEHFAEPTRTVSVRFYELIRNWPDPAWSFAVNPNTPVGAKYPGPQVIALANWATEAGLGAEPIEQPAVDPHAPVPAPEPASDDAQHATVMQKTLPPEQVDYYLERGYDRVAGFVHRATEVEHLRTPAELFGALGLTYEGSPHLPDAKEAYVLRWPAYRPSLYRIPYGGQNEQAARAMDGWVIERPPFRGNGFAPGEGRDVVAEFKVDSVRLPHGAQLWRVETDGKEHMVAIFDNDGPHWRRVGGDQ
jgi:hypothetical protein